MEVLKLNGDFQTFILDDCQSLTVWWSWVQLEMLYIYLPFGCILKCAIPPTNHFYCGIDVQPVDLGGNLDKFQATWPSQAPKTMGATQRWRFIRWLTPLRCWFPHHLIIKYP